jgi:outer membrane receptor protein involved in Fe transport
MMSKRCVTILAVTQLLALGSAMSAEPAQQGTHASSSNTNEAEGSAIEEITVTATKRTERILDVPLSITAVSAEEIERRGLVSAEDYLRGIAGVNQVRDGVGQTIIIRGIETTTTNQNYSSGATVATYFGETPTTNTAGLGGGTNVDIKLVDIERVEVLRGPQGTAFGSSSLGGAVRTIPVEPRLDRFDGRVSAGYSVTAGAGGDNQMIQGVANIPLIADRLAIRAVGYRFDDTGFYRGTAASDPGTQSLAALYGVTDRLSNEKHIGDAMFKGGRISALFQATEDLKLTFSYLTQQSELLGLTNGATGGVYDQARLPMAPEHARMSDGETRGVQNTDIDLANTTLEYTFGWGSVLATYSQIDSGGLWIWPVSFVPLSSGGPSDHHERSGEIRIVTALDGPWNLIAGVYLEDLEDEFHQTIYQYRTTGPAIFGFDSLDPFMGELFERRNLKQKAAFAELSWQFAEAWALTSGARAYDYDRSGRTATNLLAPGLPLSTTTVATDASGTTFRVNLSYKPTEDALVYAGWSQGFRLGKAQPGLLAGACDVDSDGIVDGTGNVSLESTGSVNSDEVDNYELGVKTALLDRRLTIEADVYRIDWTGVPFTVTAPLPPAGCGLNYVANAGAARSQGLDLQMSYRPTEALRIDFGGSWIDAQLTKDAPALFPPAFAGDRLPGSPKVNANLGVQYDFTLAGQGAFLRLDTFYVGAFFGQTDEAALTRAGDYLQADATAGLKIRNLAVRLFGQNLTDADEFTQQQLPFASAFSGYRLRPRTLGLQLTYDFGN